MARTRELWQHVVSDVPLVELVAPFQAFREEVASMKQNVQGILAADAQLDELWTFSLLEFVAVADDPYVNSPDVPALLSRAQAARSWESGVVHRRLLSLHSELCSAMLLPTENTLIGGDIMPPELIEHPNPVRTAFYERHGSDETPFSYYGRMLTGAFKHTALVEWNFDLDHFVLLPPIQHGGASRLLWAEDDDDAGPAIRRSSAPGGIPGTAAHDEWLEQQDRERREREHGLRYAHYTEPNTTHSIAENLV